MPLSQIYNDDELLYRESMDSDFISGDLMFIIILDSNNEIMIIIMILMKW